MRDVNEDYWKLREALLTIEIRLSVYEDVPFRSIREVAVKALRETDLANRLEPVPLTDEQLDALIKSDQGDSYYVLLPDGSTRNLGYTAEAYVERAELRAAARRVLEAS